MATRAIGRFCQRLAAGDGLCRGLGLRFAKGECGAQKHHRENRYDAAMSSVHHLSLLAPIIARKPYRPERHVVSPQAPAATQSELASALSRMTLRFANADLQCPHLYRPAH